MYEATVNFPSVPFGDLERLRRALDAGRIEAKLTSGVLDLRTPKQDQARPRRVDVLVG